MRFLVILALGVGIVGGVAASPRGGVKPSGLTSTPAEPAATDAMQVLERRVAALERLLGAPDSLATLDVVAARRDAYHRLRQRVERLAAMGEAVWAHIPSIDPIDGGRITSPYTAHRFHPILHRDQPHYGIDIAARYGTPIRAAADGTVLAVATSPTYGNAVDIDHGNGFITRYAHAARILVRPGEPVRRGQTIALVGSTGRSTGPHLHYEVFHNGWSVDPIDFVRDPATVILDD